MCVMQSDIGGLQISFHLITADTRRSQISLSVKRSRYGALTTRSTHFTSLGTCCIDQRVVPGKVEGPTMSCYKTSACHMLMHRVVKASCADCGPRRMFSSMSLKSLLGIECTRVVSTTPALSPCSDGRGFRSGRI